MIRIIGYSYFLKENQIEVDFYNSYDLPKVLQKKVKYIKFIPPFGLIKILKYYCISPKLLFFLKYIINFYPLIKKLEKINNPIIFHQNFKIGLYLTLVKKKNCIYDIHGILNLQKDFLYNLTLKSKKDLFFKLLIERNYFRYGQYFIATSNEMKNFLIKSYDIEPTNIFIAEEGLLDFYRDEVNKKLEENIRKKYYLSKENKIIFFAGDFKNFGGVWDLVKAFYIVHKKLSYTKLFLIGSGQEENRIKKFIEEKSLKNCIILVGKVDYKKLSTYQVIADIIVCPDRKNKNNEIVTHVKVYDSLASGKPVILSYFKRLKKLIRNFQAIEFFKPGDINDLANKILNILKLHNDYLNKAKYNKNKIKNYTYQRNAVELIAQLKNRFNK